MTSALDLTNGGSALVDDADVPMLSSAAWRLTPQGYAASGRATLMHRLIAEAPPGTHVDHINGDKLDNRRSNLRVVTPSANQVNRRRLNRNNRSGVRGVHWNKRRGVWLAQITVNGKGRFIGEFAEKADAAEARRLAEIKFYGEECPK